MRKRLGETLCEIGEGAGQELRLTQLPSARRLRLLELDFILRKLILAKEAKKTVAPPDAVTASNSPAFGSQRPEHVARRLLRQRR